MADNETDEEKIRALKEWWNKNGRSIIAGIVIGVGSLIGWKGWNSYQEQQAVEASDRYNNMRSAIIANNLENIVAQAQELKENYTSTPYASWGALLVAKAKEAEGDSQEAIENLQWAIDNAEQDTVKSLAMLRLARVYIATNEYAKADALLDQSYPKAFASLYQELKGDLHAQRGNIEQAREAYDAAITKAEQIDIEFLKMKRDNLGLSDNANA